VHKLAQSVLGYIHKHDLLRPGDRVGIAVSGGADSVALLRLVLELRDELGVVLFVVHLNHKLRGAESDEDEHFVRELAAQHGLEIVAESCDIKAYAGQKKLSLEAAAREARYEFFNRVLQSTVNRVATAHTLDDQAETVLFKLTRGAGTRGLAGIYPKVNVSTVGRQTIVRPLLGTRRAMLRSHLAEIGQSWREDSSNQDLRHMRNRLRREILPRLESEVNPAICETLAESADIARAEEGYWANEVDRFLPEIWTTGECGGILQLKPLVSMPLALRRRLVRAAVERLGINLDFRHVDAILDESCEGKVSLPGEWTATRHGDELRFQKASVSAADYQYDLSVPGQITVAEAGIELEILVLNGNTQSQKYDSQHLVDPGFAQKQWVVRNWRAGERFWPAHTKEPKKIKVLLQDRHVTGDQKQHWPVIACGDEIIWVKGFGVRRDFQANGAEGVLIRELEEDRRKK
jgi:tRNA(Ile)-lysidine synthase